MLRATCVLFSLGILVCTGISSAEAQNQTGRLRHIVASKAIKIAYRPDATPFSFVEGSQAVGYTIDICKQVVGSLERQLGIQSLKIEWVPVTAQTRFEAVAGGKADLECGSSTVTLGRMKLVDFSNYVFVESTGILVRTAVGIATLKDLSGKKIAVISGTTNEQAVSLVNRRAQLNATIVQVKDRDEAVAALEAGRVDGFANDKLLLVGSRFKGRQDLRLLPDDLSIEPYAIALPRGDWEMRLAVNTALAEIFRSDEIRKIFEKWFTPIGLQPGVLLGAAYLLGGLSE